MNNPNSKHKKNNFSDAASGNKEEKDSDYTSSPREMEEQLMADGMAAERAMNNKIIRNSKDRRAFDIPRFTYQGHALNVGQHAKEMAEKLEPQKLEQALELSPSLVVIMDRWGTIEYTNQRMQQVTGHTREELINKNLEYLLPEMMPGNDLNELKQALQKGRKWKGELLQKRKDGEVHFLSGKLEPLQNEYGFISGFILSGQDVTSFRNTQQKLQQTLEEKNVMLSELHHRVKNNLAIVSGLMQLQAFNEPDQAVQEKLFSSAGRVKSMASMHEILYQSESLNHIDMEAVIQKILEVNKDLYMPQNQSVIIHFTSQPVQLNINQAHACALIFNEAITNVFKHAFRNREEGLVEITLRQKDARVKLSVTDNGEGGYRIDSSTGQELLNSLSNQLGAEYRYTSGNEKTCFSMEFTREEINGASSANLL